MTAVRGGHRSDASWFRCGALRRLVALAAFLCVGAAAATPASAALRVTVQRSQVGRVPNGFLGLGLEYRTVTAYAGATPKAINPVLVQLIRNISSGQRPVFRIGGISTDRTWWPIRGMRRSPGITANLTRSVIGVIKAVTDASNAQLILGVNLEANNPRIAGAEIAALRSQIGANRIVAYELGNEPELYTGVAWYAKRGNQIIPWYLRRLGTPVYSRPRSYNFNSFTSDFSRFRRALGHDLLAGPSTGNFSWLTQIRHFLAANPGLRVVTFHRYGLNQCVKDPRSPHYPSVPHLLTALASRGMMNGVGPYIGIAHKHHAQFMIDEAGAVTCNGRPGVSNSFASALWSVDALFNMARMGIDGVQFHSFQGNPNGLFDFRQVHGKWVGSVHAPYYGSLMFAQAAPAGARLLHVIAPHAGEVRIWSTIAPDGTIRVVLINDSLRQRSSAILRMPAGLGSATVTRLQARSAYATGGVTFGGRSFGSRTSTGTLGAPKLTTVNRTSAGYPVSVPAASAALVTFAPK